MKRGELSGLHRWSRHEYGRMIDHGLLDEDDPIELLERSWRGRPRGGRRPHPRHAAVMMVGVIRSFADAATEDLFNGVASRRARAACPEQLWAVVRRKLTQLNRVRELRELAIPPGNRLEALRSDRTGQHSIRINDQYRVCFRWENGHADKVEVTDYH